MGQRRYVDSGRCTYKGRVKPLVKFRELKNVRTAKMDEEDLARATENRRETR